MYSFQADFGGVSLKTALPRPPQAIRAGPVLHHGVHAPLVCRDAGRCVLCWMALHCVLLHACMCMSTLCCVCMCVHVYSFLLCMWSFFCYGFFFSLFPCQVWPIRLCAQPIREACPAALSPVLLRSLKAPEHIQAAVDALRAMLAKVGRKAGGRPRLQNGLAYLVASAVKVRGGGGGFLFFVALPVPPVSSYFWV